MIKIKIPNNNINERYYIIDIVFKDFLGLEYKVIKEEDINSYQIELCNNSKLIVEDHFFNLFPQDKEYLDINNIPSNIEYVQNSFIQEDDIPIIYGTSNLVLQSSSLQCGIDIFGSIFFMLTRWEEHINKNRDSHDRFPATKSISYRFGFLNRPVVNEYLEMFKSMLFNLDNLLKFRTHESKTYISCDVDHPFDCTVKNIKNLTRVCLGDIVKRKSLFTAFKRIRRYFFNKLEDFRYDENYTFEWYMDKCEEAGLKAAFYFIPDSSEKGNGCYNLNDKKIQNLLKYIDSRGHEIGVHGSYQTYQDKEKAKLQKNMLDDTLSSLGISQKVVGNRQHYLRWDSSVTPSNIEHAGFKYDTTGSYADLPGFRYGVCYDFKMFDFLNRKTLNLIQRPLVVMECTIIDEIYMGLGYSETSVNLMKELKSKCFQYNGNFSLLWHNSNFKYEDDKSIFQEILNA